MGVTVNERSFIVKSQAGDLRFLDFCKPRQILTGQTRSGLLNGVKLPVKTQLSIDPKIVASFPPNRCYLIGVSGGRDSVALWHRLADLGYRRLVVCHLDHQLRGSASTADARFVRRMAAKRKAECEVDRIDVAALARRTKQSVETAARIARYEFLARIARRRRCRTVFLGHHADDLVETFLINLFRGAGPAGFAAIHPIASRKVEGVELKIVRPLLGVWRTEIDAYVKAHRLEFREDATNETLGPVRNRVRNRIIPYIEKQLERKVRGAIWRAALIAADETEWLTELLDSEKAGIHELAVKDLRALPRALQRRTIHLWLQVRGVTNLDFETIERVRALLDPEATMAKTNLPRDRHARRRAGKIFIE